MLSLSLSDKFCCFGIFVFVFVNENHTADTSFQSTPPQSRSQGKGPPPPAKPECPSASFAEQRRSSPNFLSRTPHFCHPHFSRRSFHTIMPILRIALAKIWHFSVSLQKCSVTQKYVNNAFPAGTPPRTALGEPMTLSRPLNRPGSWGTPLPRPTLTQRLRRLYSCALRPSLVPL